MTVISISIQESSEQIVSGIPKYVTITTNIPSTIFYTLDGTDPNLYSSIYVDMVKLPTEYTNITLKVFATNGIDNSPIISEVYFSNILENARRPHSSTTDPSQALINDKYPFGSANIPVKTKFLNPGNSGLNVNDPSLPTIPSGYDGDGYETGQTNKPYTFDNYDIIYSQGDFINAPIKVGHLPTNIKVLDDPNPAAGSETTDQASKFFDPKAFVIYQDAETEDVTKPPLINRQHFSLESSDKVRTGNNFFVSGLDAPPTTGAFVKSHYNPRDNTTTYYYFDQIANRWIISKIPYQNKNPEVGQLYHLKFGRNQGVGYVFSWSPFRNRVLF